MCFTLTVTCDPLTLSLFLSRTQQNKKRTIIKHKWSLHQKLLLLFAIILEAPRVYIKEWKSNEIYYEGILLFNGYKSNDHITWSLLKFVLLVWGKRFFLIVGIFFRDSSLRSWKFTVFEQLGQPPRRTPPPPPPTTAPPLRPFSQHAELAWLWLVCNGHSQ